MPVLLLAMAMLTAQAPTDYRALAAVKPATVVARVRACGFRRIRIADDPELQEDVIRVSDAAATQDQLHCVARASLASPYYVEFPSPIQARYQRVYFELQRKRVHADAIAWLAKRGLLDKLPKFDRSRAADPATARAIEKVCGPKVIGFLKPSGSFVTVDPTLIATLKPDDGDAFTCLTNSAEATGYPLGFIGNEAYRVEDKQPQ